MELLEELRENKNGRTVVYKQFIELYPKHPNCIYCFFEGKMDDKYYGLRIDKYFEEEKEYLCCHGKSNVLYMKRMIGENSEYNQCKGLFFVDRDFDGMIGDEKIFETPCYAIENLYTQRYSMEQIINREFYISKIDENYENICRLYEEAFEQFHEVIKILNVWIYFQREKEKIFKKEKKLHLEKLSRNSLYVLTLNKADNIVKVERKYGLKDLEKMFPEAYPISEEEFQIYSSRIEMMNPGLDYRGKQELEFFCCFLEKVIEELTLCKKNKENRGILVFNSDMQKISLNLSAKKQDVHILTLANYASTPKELNEYLEKMAQQYM